MPGKQHPNKFEHGCDREPQKFLKWAISNETSVVRVDRDGKSMWIYDRCGGNTCEDSKIAPLTKYDSSGKVVAAKTVEDGPRLMALPKV